MAKSTILPVVAALLLLPARTGAQNLADYTAAVVTPSNNCLIPDTRGELRIYSCTSSGARYRISNGVVRDIAGRCWDHGVPQGADLTRNNAVHLVKCHGGKSQIWYFIPDSRALVQSAANSAACITVEGQQIGARALVTQCTYQNPPQNQRFFPGELISAAARQSLKNLVTAEALQYLSTRGSATFSNDTRMVAAGGGNIIAAGMVAAGGGNMVAAGGGNLLGNDGGSLRALLRGAHWTR